MISSAAAVAASSVAANTSGSTEELMPGLDFNVDSLNLGSLGGLAGLDFDVANLLRQVSGSATAPLSANAIIDSIGGELDILDDPINVPISAPSILSADSNDHVDVIQKTMLPVDAPVRLCLCWGHATRKPLTSSLQPGGGDIGWIHQFEILCICK
ncbi:hypothetical protein IW148_003887 [Coemansia sp. RSA 1199]|nr:hypothetical protein IW148_003887 [Coemansia sp. RSA 1199]